MAASGAYSLIATCLLPPPPPPTSRSLATPPPAARSTFSTWPRLVIHLCLRHARAVAALARAREPGDLARPSQHTAMTSTNGGEKAAKLDKDDTPRRQKRKRARESAACARCASSPLVVQTRAFDRGPACSAAPRRPQSGHTKACMPPAQCQRTDPVRPPQRARARNRRRQRLARGHQQKQHIRGGAHISILNICYIPPRRPSTMRGGPVAMYACAKHVWRSESRRAAAKVSRPAKYIDQLAASLCVAPSVPRGHRLVCKERTAAR